VFLGIAACLLAGGVVFWVRGFDSAGSHAEFCRITRVELESLARKRPEGVTREQWHHVVAWTLNGHGNILEFKQDIPQAERDLFVSELRERLAGPAVDLSTIDWIWDQYERLWPGYGPVYSGRYRPTSPERLREFQREGFTWVGVEVE
jgi:hypothetical protein